MADISRDEHHKMTEDLQKVLSWLPLPVYSNIYWIYNISVFRKSFISSTEMNEITVCYWLQFVMCNGLVNSPENWLKTNAYLPHLRTGWEGADHAHRHQVNQEQSCDGGGVVVIEDQGMRTGQGRAGDGLSGDMACWQLGWQHIPWVRVRGPCRSLLQNRSQSS